MQCLLLWCARATATKSFSNNPNTEYEQRLYKKKFEKLQKHVYNNIQNYTLIQMNYYSNIQIAQI